MKTWPARRLDWHALLPEQREPGRWLIVGADQGLADLAVRLGLAASAATEPDRSDPADVVAVLRDAPGAVERAVTWLAPRGHLYWEVDRRSFGHLALTPSRAARRLEAAGLAVAAIYWVGPRWSRPRRFLPVTPPDPLAWYLSTSRVLSGLPAAVGGPIRRVLTSGQLLGWLVPRFAVVASWRGGDAETTPSALDRPEIPAAVRASSVPPVLVCRGDEAWGRITLIAFENGRRSPSTVVKISRHAVFDDATCREHEVLLDLHERVDAVVRRALPEPLGLIRVGGRPAVVQSAMNGSAAVARMRRPLLGSQVASEDLQRTTSWLISMHRQTLRSRVAAGSPGWTLHVDERLERFHAAFGRRPDIVRLFDELRADAAASGCDLPIVLCHRDLGPWNVLVDREDVRVIDWEVARDGPALTDLVYACLHWRFESLRDRTEANRARQLRRILLGPAGPGPGIASIRDAVRRYIHEVDVDPRLIPMLVILTLVDQALDRFDRLQLRGARDTDSSNDNRYVRYVTEVASYSTDWLTQSRRFLGGR